MLRQGLPAIGLLILISSGSLRAAEAVDLELVLLADGRDRFAEAVRRKLLLEIAGGAATGVQARREHAPRGAGAIHQTLASAP
jgi:hypothetical protein